MVTGPGVLIPIVIWAGLIAWVGRVAKSRGRIPGVWALAAAVAGAGSFMLGILVDVSAFNSNDVMIGLTMLSMLLPMVFMLAAMIGIGVALQRKPYGATRKRVFDVHILQRGPGQLRIENDRIALSWPDGSRDVPFRELERVEADGEALRVCAGDTYVLLPVAEGLSPDGRRHLSRQIALRLGAS